LIYGKNRFTLPLSMIRKSRKNVGLIGLGIIGSRIAGVLRSAGYNVYVWSRRPRIEPNFLGSPGEIAEVANIIHVFVSDAAALYEVIELFEDKLTPRHIIICNATIGPEATIEAARRIGETGANFVDAPFTGSRDAAGEGQIVYYLGGEDDVLDAVEPVLRASSKALVRVGHIGQAAAVKIATNMLVAVTTQALAETIAVMHRAGVNPIILEEALEHHAVHSRLIDMKLPIMLRGEFEPHFSFRNLSKDVQLALAMANSRDIELPALTATAGVLHKGLHLGWGDLDFAALIKVYESQPVNITELTHPDPLEDGAEAPNEGKEHAASNKTHSEEASGAGAMEIESGLDTSSPEPKNVQPGEEDPGDSQTAGPATDPAETSGNGEGGSFDTARTPIGPESSQVPGEAPSGDEPPVLEEEAPGAGLNESEAETAKTSSGKSGFFRRLFR
jgi:3-hydroxyisobutyrate dehydrogenase-like beta-hydroxyacid dehydrogenase